VEGARGLGTLRRVRESNERRRAIDRTEGGDDEPTKYPFYQDRKSLLTPKLLVISFIVVVVLCLLASAFLPPWFFGVRA